MTFNRRDFMLPAVVSGLLAALPAHAGSDEESVARKLEEFRTAQLKSDGARLTALSAPELSYSHSDGHIEDRATFVANAVKRTASPVAYRDPNIRVVGDAAVVRFTWVPESPPAAGSAPANLHILMVWQKQDNDWRLLARSATKL